MSVLYVTVAKPGHGKSYVSEQVSQLSGAKHIRSDVVRKEEVAEEEPTYSSEESQKTYDLLFQKAEETLNSGRSVVLDATFNKKIGREKAVEVADRTGSKVVFIEVRCDSETAKKRIRERDGVSDADVELYENFMIEPVEDKDTVVIDNSGSMKETKEQVKQILSDENF